MNKKVIFFISLTMLSLEGGCSNSKAPAIILRSCKKPEDIEKYCNCWQGCTQNFNKDPDFDYTSCIQNCQLPSNYSTTTEDQLNKDCCVF